MADKMINCRIWKWTHSIELSFRVKLIDTELSKLNLANEIATCSIYRAVSDQTEEITVWIPIRNRDAASPNVEKNCVCVCEWNTSETTLCVCVCVVAYLYLT